jgi:hypothetical protein
VYGCMARMTQRHEVKLGVVAKTLKKINKKSGPASYFGGGM